MNRLVGAPLAIFLASMLVGCPGKTNSAADSPASSGAQVETKTPRAEPPAVGTVFAYHMFNGVSREDEVTAVGTATVTVARGVSFAKDASRNTVEEPLDGPSPQATIRPDMTFKVLGEETIVVSGVSFECEVREAKVGQNVLREWVSPRFPHVVRTRANGFVTLDLAEIRPPKETRK
jgi:hypothetical protein